MFSALRISLCLGIIVYFIFIIILLRKNLLTLKYTILWIIFGIAMLFVLVVPGFIEWLSAILGIKTPSNTVFALALFFMLIIIMSLSAIASNTNDKCKRLIQNYALLEKRIRDLESEKADQQNTTAPGEASHELHGQ